MVAQCNVEGQARWVARGFLRDRPTACRAAHDRPYGLPHGRARRPVRLDQKKNKRKLATNAGNKGAGCFKCWNLDKDVVQTSLHPSCGLRGSTCLWAPAWEILARGHPMALGWPQDPARPAWEVLAYGTPWDKNGITFKTIVSESNTKMVLLSKTVFLNVVPKWYYF